MYVQTVARMF